MKPFIGIRLMPGLAIIAGALIGLPAALALERHGSVPAAGETVVRAEAIPAYYGDRPDAVGRTLTNSVTGDRATTQGSFIRVASAASAAQDSPLQPRPEANNAASVVPQWLVYAVALLLVAVLGVILKTVRRRHESAVPVWCAPAAQTVPNFPKLPAQHGGGLSRATTSNAPRNDARAGAAGTGNSLSSRPTPSATRNRTPRTPIADALSKDFDADMIEERMIRREWAKAMKDGAVDLGSDSILKAIEQAERELQIDAQPTALDLALDDELIKHRAAR